MANATPIGNLAECYASALAIEREAAERCAQFAEFLEDHGAQGAAQLFSKLARFEQQHVEELERRSSGMPLPALRPWEFNWLDDAPAEQVNHAFVFHLMTPHDALKIALGAEKARPGALRADHRDDRRPGSEAAGAGTGRRGNGAHRLDRGCPGQGAAAPDHRGGLRSAVQCFFAPLMNVIGKTTSAAACFCGAFS
ncbi:MAG: ferritin family protein [Rhodocyclaceae bacterium]|nr:ferritin family protein [Rhodocyclaceae bacterium]